MGELRERFASGADETALRAVFHVVESGLPAARPMVFAHGYATSQDVWRHVAPAFEADHRVVLFDHLGAGTEAQQEVHDDLYGYAADVVVLLKGLGLRDVPSSPASDASVALPRTMTFIDVLPRV